MTAEQRDYRTSAGKPEDAIEEAKQAARAEGRRIRTLGRIRGTPGRYIVTLAVEVRA